MYALIALGGIAGLFSLVAPKGNRFIYVGLSLVAYPIGLVVSHVLLAVLFFGLITPLGLLIRTLKKDSLHRERDATASSYWVAASPARPKSRYFRQF